MIALHNAARESSMIGMKYAETEYLEYKYRPLCAPNGSFKEAYNKHMPDKSTNLQYVGPNPGPHLQVGDHALLIEGKITGDRRGLRYPSISGERIPSLNFLPPCCTFKSRGVK
jgi:hypothetical protein